jgi:dipeptidase E
MKLFLSGGGIGENSREIDNLFANAVDKSKALLYIPIAMDEKKRSYSECLRFIKDVFNPRGIKDIVMCSEKEIGSPPFELSDFGGIYIGGGNTFYLLDKLRENGFDSKLIQAIQNGIPYYGGSAGAIICGESIETSFFHDEDIVGLKDFKGFGLVEGYSLFCHYEEQELERIKRFSNEKKLNVIALPENCGLYVSEEGIKVAGKGKPCRIISRTTLSS